MEVNIYSRTSFYKDVNASNDKPAADASNGRGKWWQHTVRNTPLPGAYDSLTFLQEGDRRPVQRTYGFSNCGRKRNADPSQTGSLLLPGNYHYDDFAKMASMKQCTYSFKGTRRSKGTGTKADGTRPSQGSHSASSDKNSCQDSCEKARPRTYNFKSTTKRFPTIQFAPRDGPGPAQYQSATPRHGSHPMTSSFKSRTPRFLQPRRQTNTPGPGTYTKILSSKASPVSVQQVGRYRGLFYPIGSY